MLNIVTVKVFNEVGVVSSLSRLRHGGGEAVSEINTYSNAFSTFLSMGNNIFLYFAAYPQILLTERLVIKIHNVLECH